MLKTVLIANRGEIAIRIIRACRLLNFKTIAVYSDVDSSSLHVRMADEAHCLGNGSVQNTYLNIEKIIEIAVETSSGGPLAEKPAANPAFDADCVRAGWL